MMSMARSDWFSVGGANAMSVRCASCSYLIKFESPSIDHHSAICPACRVECTYISWRDCLIQIVMPNAPESLRKTIRLLQDHLDELEFIEVIMSLEELNTCFDQNKVDTENPE